MADQSLSPILTILIPTRNKAKNLDNTLRRIIKSVEYAKADDGTVEIVIANNLSSDNTEEISRNWSNRYQYIKYYKHQESYPSAEESLFNGIKYCNGEYVWSFGDDDYMHHDAIIKLLDVLNKSQSQFVLLNCDILTPDKKHIIQYMRSNKDLVEYKNGIDLFKDFGLISATTTLSCLVFKRERIDISLFKQFSNISAIYSHSAFLLTSFYNVKSAFLAVPILTYKSNVVDDEMRNIVNNSKDNGRFELFSFTTGILRLVENISLITKIPKREILFCREVEINRQFWCVKHTVLIHFIIRNYLQQIMMIGKNSIMYKIKNLTEITDYIKELIDLSAVLESEAFNQDIYLKRISKIASRYRFILSRRARVKKLARKITKVVNCLEWEELVKIKSKNRAQDDVLITNSDILFKKLTVEYDDTKQNSLDAYKNIFKILNPR
jgi:glycosyltransferase involved in cell wall biosynthesis